MKKITFYVLFSLLSTMGFAQEYATPGNNSAWTLTQIAQDSPQTLSQSGNVFTLSQDLTISETDTLKIIPGDTLKVDSDILIKIEGSLQSKGNQGDMILITSSQSNQPFQGIRLEASSTAEFLYTKITYSGGIKAISPVFTMTHCTMQNNTSGVSTGAAISFSYGSPAVVNSTFLNNDLPAISSPANGDVSAVIINNYIKENGQLNQNRPQINMGTTGADTLRIIGNTIIGDRNKDMVGGIAVVNLVNGEINALIQGNTIQDNRYGITVIGNNAEVKISNNIIEDNDSQGDPNLGGSGISISSGDKTQHIMASGNEIRRNLWGITVIDAHINLGDDDDNPGQNVFSENGNNGLVYALYNNSSNTILAKHNCWIEGQESSLEDVAEVIVDQSDDSTLGEVIYDPINCGNLSVETPHLQEISFYPNPAKDEIHINTDKTSEVSIFSLQGKEVFHTNLDTNKNNIQFNLESGIYFIRFENENGSQSKKLIIK